MKCLNCGWDNADSATVCLKCHSPLVYNQPASPQPTQMQMPQMPSPPMPAQPYATQPAPTAIRMPIQGTTKAAPQPASSAPLLCSRCGYPMSQRMQKCPNCYSTDAPTYADIRQAKTCPECDTVIDAEDRFCRRCGAAVDKGSLAKRNIQGDNGDPFDSHGNYFFTLRPLASKGEAGAFTPITFTGSTVVLNRSNTDPENKHISPNQQAVLINEKGKWMLDNRSQAYTTMLRVMRPVEVKSGDIIILGSRAFEFKI